MGYFLLLAWTATSVFSLATNRDIFSPVKLYLFCLFLFFADIFFTPYDLAVSTTYLGLLVLGLFLAIQESHLPKPSKTPLSARVVSRPQLRRITVMLWLVSIVPLCAQAYLVTLMGGFEGYVNTLGLRVMEHRGLGPITIVIGVFPVINLVYFVVGLLSRNARPAWWLGFCLHMCLFLIIGLLSGSRGLLLNNFVLMLITYHYLRREVSIITAVTTAMALIVVAGVIGIARNGYRVGDHGLETGLRDAEQVFQTTHFRYGLIPLELVFSRSPDDLEYGLTFLSVFTNPIPRKLWPEKPDSGGLVLTKKYTGDAWDGYSNLSPGLIGESVLNFGWWFGVPFGFVLLWLLMTYVLARYSDMLRKRNRHGGLALVWPILSHIIIMRAITSLPCGEFTNTLVATVIGRLLPLAFVAGLAMRVGSRGTRDVRGSSVRSSQLPWRNRRFRRALERRRLRPPISDAL